MERVMPADLATAQAGSAPRPVTRAMRPLLYVFFALTLLSTLLLYVLAEETERFFAWTIAVPLSAAFLGAGYAAGSVLTITILRERAWANARVGFVAVLLFTTLTLVATLVHLDRFHLDASAAIARASAWLWLAVYVVVPLWMAALLVVQRRAAGSDPPVLRPIPRWLGAVLAIEGASMVAAGAALFAAQSWAMTRWPWELTPLTSRAVGAWLVALGVAALHASAERDIARVRSAALTYAVLGVLQLAALVRFSGDVRWESAYTWLYVALLVALTATGLYGRFSRSPALTERRPVAPTA